VSVWEAEVFSVFVQDCLGTPSYPEQSKELCELLPSLNASNFFFSWNFLALESSEGINECYSFF